MAIKKSDLYSSIWKSCDELRGGMDASQYKDYVLTMLFIKYVSDKYAGQEDALLVIPEGSSFKDMVKLKGKSDIGDKINTQIIAPIAEANGLQGVIDQTDFNDDEKLGSGKEKVNRLSNLVGIFQNDALDFADNRAGGDDLLGDAYEYLMRHFATESGKSKGQFYTPAEVSRILSKVLGVEQAERPTDTVYDPTCGSGSLLLKVANEAKVDITIYGQEMDNATSALAKMNMVLHNQPTAVHSIKRGNTLADPKWTENGHLKRFNYVVANPPFSYKAWTNGLEPENDFYNRFDGFGIPPCILVLDKEEADARDGIFMIDASEGYKKDGNKNRLRERDIHKVVDYFRSQTEVESYARIVPNEEIAANDYNLNIPRYIDTTEEEDIQDLQAHLKGGIPARDIDGLKRFWQVYPTMKQELFSPLRQGYSELKVHKDAINDTIFGHPEFEQYRQKLDAVFAGWKDNHYAALKSISRETAPSNFINSLSENLLDTWSGTTLIDKYDIYQHLMDYWAKTMKDDVYMIVEDGWQATLEPVRTSKGKIKKGQFECELIPKRLVIDRYFPEKQEEIAQLKQKQETADQTMDELEQEHGHEEGLLGNCLSDAGNITKTNLKKRVKQINDDASAQEEYEVVRKYKDAYDAASKAKKKVKKAQKALRTQVNAKYPELSPAEVQTLVVDDKWLPDIRGKIEDEVEAVSRHMTQRLKELAERYDRAVTDIDNEVDTLETKVNGHLTEMGV